MQAKRRLTRVLSFGNFKNQGRDGNIPPVPSVLIGQAQDAHDGKKTATKRNSLHDDDLPDEDESVPPIPSVLISKAHESHDGDKTPTQRNSLEDDNLPDEYTEMFTLPTEEMLKCCIRAVAKSHRRTSNLNAEPCVQYSISAKASSLHAYPIPVFGDTIKTSREPKYRRTVPSA
ncbi:hypothetical protein B0H17DRAFT_1173677 [Mycena rosella]|uniref:Uncharacterized protein n=1 Tax=Mycena rosella TaxID=1033263 RepID=A0AAD7H2Y9_MYCRO|nr:hypothetical protein B0H17DRAFT_1173677 [Mycena rosella]